MDVAGLNAGGRNTTNLTVSLRNKQTGESFVRSVSLAQFAFSERKENISLSFPLDERGSVLTLERTLDDELPVRVVRNISSAVAPNTLGSVNFSDYSGGKMIPSLVFDPNETMILSVFPRFLQNWPFLTSNVLTSENSTSGTEISKNPFFFHVRIQNHSTAEIVWEGKAPLNFKSGNRFNSQFDLPITVPESEGVFDIQIAVMKSLPAQSGAFGIKKETAPEQIAKRNIQIVVLERLKTTSTASSWGNSGHFDLRDGLVETIDPSNSNWWSIFSRRNGKNQTSGSDETAQIEDPVKGQTNSQFNSQINGQINTQNPQLISYSPSSVSNTVNSNTANSSTGFLGLPTANWKWGEFLKQPVFGNNGFWRSFPKMGQSKALWQSALGSGDLEPYLSSVPGQNSLSQIRPSGDSNIIPWEAYTVPIKEIGKPHLLEIEYLPGHPQELGISLIEPCVSGGVFPDSVDFGLTVPEERFDDQNESRLMYYRVLFWPKTETPMFVLMNRSPKQPAVFGRIRVYRAKEELLKQSVLEQYCFQAVSDVSESPLSASKNHFFRQNDNNNRENVSSWNGTAQNFRPQTDKNGQLSKTEQTDKTGQSDKKEKKGRLFAGYISTPDFCSQFSVPRTQSSKLLLGAEDWSTFYSGTERLIQQLQATGYNGLMLTVTKDGSALYPSSILNPSPKFDNGIFLSGQDPVRKDVLELMFRFFDRENLTLIPIINFNAPLPKLENKLREYKLSEMQKILQRSDLQDDGLNSSLPNHSSSYTAQKGPLNSLNQSNLKPLAQKNSNQTILNQNSSNQFNSNQNNLNQNNLNQISSNQTSLNPSSPINQNGQFSQVNQPVSYHQTVQSSQPGRREVLSRLDELDYINVQSGYFWVAPDGRTLEEHRRAKSTESSVCYNLLHPDVQNAMIETAEEIVQRYSRHPAFCGIGIELCADGFAQLPDDVMYGMDDATVGRFVREVSLTLPREGRQISLEQLNEFKGTDRFAQRADFIRRQCFAEWIRWRNETVYQFYRRLRETIAKTSPNAKVYLSGTKMLDGVWSQRQLYPTLTERFNIQNILEQIGFDLTLFRLEPNLVFLRPGKLESFASLGKRASSVSMESSLNVDSFMKLTRSEGTIFEHLSETRNLNSFDVQSPFNPTLTQIKTVPSLADFQARRRFVHQLSHSDVLNFFDGGTVLPKGQEEAVREFAAVFQYLPNTPFTTFVPTDETTQGTTTQPVVLRLLADESGTWGYFLNDAPFHSTVKIAIGHQQGSEFRIFSTQTPPSKPVFGLNSMLWTLTLRPFEILAFRLSDPNAKIRQFDVFLPEDVCSLDGRLGDELRLFIDRVQFAKKGLTVDLENASFDDISWIQRYSDISWNGQNPGGISKEISENSQYSSEQYSAGHQNTKKNGNSLSSSGETFSEEGKKELNRLPDGRLALNPAEAPTQYFSENQGTEVQWESSASQNSEKGLLGLPKIKSIPFLKKTFAREEQKQGQTANQTSGQNVNQNLGLTGQNTAQNIGQNTTQNIGQNTEQNVGQNLNSERQMNWTPEKNNTEFSGFSGYSESVGFAGTNGSVGVDGNSGIVLDPNASSFPLLPESGWTRFGTNDFIAEIDRQHSMNGNFSLMLKSNGAPGAVLSRPIETPTTGRLCVQLGLGIPEKAVSLPLRLVLTGRFQGAPWQRTVVLGPAFLERAKKELAEKKITPQNQVLWVEDMVLFDRLPLYDLENLSLRFDFLEEGQVWIDRIRLYKFALDVQEQKSLMQLIETAKYRIEKKKVADSVSLLESYWAQLLQEQLPENQYWENAVSGQFVSGQTTSRQTVSGSPADTENGRPSGRIQVSENNAKQLENQKNGAVSDGEGTKKSAFGKMFDWIPTLR